MPTSEVIPADGAPVAVVGCGHPQKALTACTYQQTPKGKWGWYYRCRACLGWFAC